MQLKMKDIVQAHQERKRQLDALEEEHKRQTAPLKQEIALLESAAHKMLTEAGDKSVRTDAGTAYRQKWTKAKITDWSAFWEWCRKHDRGDFLAKQANKSVLQEEIERVREETGEEYTGSPVPGVELEEGWKCNIRKTPQ